MAGENPIHVRWQRLQAFAARLGWALGGGCDVSNAYPVDPATERGLPRGFGVRGKHWPEGVHFVVGHYAGGGEWHSLPDLGADTKLDVMLLDSRKKLNDSGIPQESFADPGGEFNADVAAVAATIRQMGAAAIAAGLLPDHMSYRI